ncbi:MAG: hypothetical protein NVS3B14_07370 [Ktedonobacteraceae bacterium]
MDWSRDRIASQLRAWSWWKRLLIDITVAILPVAVITVPVFFLHPHTHIAIATLLLVYLVVVLILAYKGGSRVAILAAVFACITFDFFLLDPVFTLWVEHLEDGIDLIFFLVLAILVSFILAQHRKLAERAQQLSELESIRFEARLQEQQTEVNRRDYELRAFFNVIEVTRDQKELKEQLSLIAQTIMNTFAFCGIRGCSFILPDLESNVPLVVMPACAVAMPDLAPEDERSVMYVMKHGQSVELSEIPLVTHAWGNNYFRRVVASNASVGPSVYYRNYLTPLFSGQKVLGVMRLYVEDNANPELEAIKQVLEKETSPSDIHAEHFLHLFDHAVSIIKQSLIERALMQEEAMRVELQKRAAALHTAIISSVSHDFHLPLTLIKSAASSMLNQGGAWNDEGEYRSTLEAMIGEVVWLERIVLRMLDLSRIENGALKPEKELYPMDTVILAALESSHMRRLVQGRKIDIDILEDLPAVELDPALIGQVLANLVENAIRYTPAASPIEINVHADKQSLFVCVADRGPGIPPLELDRIFERFYRVKRYVDEHGGTSAEAERGSGLGLAVCQGFVEAHGGRIWAENRPGGGASFHCTLPLHAAEGIDHEKDSRR